MIQLYCCKEKLDAGHSGIKRFKKYASESLSRFDIRGICELYRRALDVPKSNWLEVVTSNYLIQSLLALLFLFTKE